MNKVRRQIVRALLGGNKSFWELIRHQDGDLPSFCREVEALLREGLIQEEGRTLTLTSAGKEIAAGEGLRELQLLRCEECGGKGIKTVGLFAEVAEEFRRLTTNRPPAIAEFDQGYVEPENTVARVAYLYMRGDLEKRRLFILGDDDLTSIAAALTGMPEGITVAEIDERLVDYINNLAKEKGWSNLRAVKYDVRMPLPDEWKQQYDVFVTDPVETVPGISLFLSRCAETLKGAGCAGYFGLTHLEASRRKWHTIQRILLDMNLVITDIIRDFHSYLLEREGFIAKNYPLVEKAPVTLPAPEINWYTSSLFRLEAIDQTRPAVTGTGPEGRELYFDDESYATLP